MDSVNAIEAIEMAGSVVETDLSVWALFMKADLIVKSVMLILLVCSVWCWAIVFEKLMKLKKLNKRADRFEEIFWSGRSLDSLYDRVVKSPNDPMTSTFVSGMREWKQSQEKATLLTDSTKASILHRIDRVMHTTITREMDRVEKSMTILASVGSTAPFVGLFGTVWGIMNAFTSIANSNNTSLAVVAPGIAEALFATALGLVAAIPAVIAYNKFSNDLTRYGDRLDNFSVDFSSILSRHLDEKG